MRLLVLALVVANAAFFSWRFNEQVEAKIAAARPVTPLSGDSPTLTLVGELDELPPPRVAPKKPQAQPTPAPAPAALADSAMPTEQAATPTEAPVVEAPAPVAPTSTGTPSGVCVHIGPFATPTEYDALQQWLQPRATSLRLETTSTAKRQLFWVYLEPRSESEAQQNIADLERKGVSDYLLINRNGLNNAISLGVFSSQDAVNRRLAEMTKKGYKPLVVPRIETTDMHWLNAEFATGYDDTSAIPTELRGNAGVEPLDCTRLAGAATSPEA